MHLENCNHGYNFIRYLPSALKLICKVLNNRIPSILNYILQLKFRGK